jgi:hypothetical protein
VSAQFVNLTFSLGQTLFVRTSDPAVQQLATLEAVRYPSLVVSFPKPGRARRDDPIELPIEQVVSADWIPNAPDFIDQDQNFVAGRTMAAYRTETEISLFLVLKNTESHEPNVAVAVANLTEPGRIEFASEVALISKSSLVRPAFLCELEMRRYFAPVHPYYHLLESPVGDCATYDGGTEFRLPHVTLPVTAQLALQCEDFEIRVQTRRAVATAFAKLPVDDMLDGEIIAEKNEPSWRAEHLSVETISMRGELGEAGPQYSDLKVLAGLARVTYGQAAADFTREVFSGASLDGYTDILKRRERLYAAALVPRPDCIETSVFGRYALIYEPSDTNASNKKRLALFHVGPPFVEQKVQAISVLLGYIAGGRLKHVLTETFDAFTKQQVLFTNGSPATQRTSPPLPFMSAYPTEAREAATFLPSMLERLHTELLKNASAVNAIFHHYAEAAGSGFPSTRLLQLSIALEALITFVTGDSRSSEPILQHSYGTLRAALDEVLQRADAAKIPGVDFGEETLSLYQSKLLKEFNSGPSLSRIREFWKIVNVNVSRDDLAFLRRIRNSMVHAGFVRDEASEAGLRKMHRDANRLGDLFNRGFLGFLGYLGPVLGSDGKCCLHIQTGARYQTSGQANDQPSLMLALNMNEEFPLTARESDAVRGMQSLLKASESE